MSVNRLRGIAGLLLLAIAASAPALAGAANAPADTMIIPVEGVTVTGSRMPESLLRTPAALSLIPRARFESTRQISLADGLGSIPGVFAQSRAGAQDVRITIRGYGARGNGDRSNSGSMRGIRIMTDGIPITEPDGRSSLDLVDLGGTDRIEVLRSNGSALYGNASGGVVNLRTSTAFDQPFGELLERAGAYGFHREQGRGGITMGRGRGTLSVFNSAFDGWREHSQSATTSVQSRFASPVDEHSRLGLLMDFASNFNRYPGALTAAELAADPRQANPTYVTRDERRFNRIGRVGVTFDRDLGTAQDLSLATWVEPKVLQRSERNRFRDFTRYHVGGSGTWQLRQPLGGDRAIQWMAGADDQFQDGSIQFYELGPGGSRGDSLIANKREGANSAGGFVQAELLWKEQWSFRIAARYDNLWYISEDRIDPALNATKHFTQVTPKGSIARFLGKHTVFASVGGGIEAPAFNEIDPPPPYDTLTSFNPFLDPMRSTSYELGARGLLAGEEGGAGRLSYDAALYWIDVANDIIPFDGGAYFFTAGKSRRRGVELGLDWTPWAPLTVSGALTLSRNEYLEYTNDLGTFDGKEVAGLPEATFEGAAHARVLPGLTVAGTLKHVGGYFADDANTASVMAFDIVGLQADYAPPVLGSLRVFVAADNLTDQDYVASVFINGVSGRYYEPGLPRNVSAGLTVSFR